MVRRSLSSSFVGLIVALGVGQALGAGTSSLRATGAVLLFARLALRVQGQTQLGLRHDFDFRGHIGHKVVDSVGGVIGTVADGMQHSGVGLVFDTAVSTHPQVEMSVGPAPGRGIDISSPGDAGGVSIEVLLKVHDFGQGAPIFSCSAVSPSMDEFVLWAKKGGMFEATFDANTADPDSTASSVSDAAYSKAGPRSTKQWYHIVVTLRNGAGKLYVDGEEFSSSNNPGSIALVDRKCFLGKGSTFQGEIGFLRVYDGIMNPTGPDTGGDSQVEIALAAALPVRVPLHLFDFRGDIFSYGAAPTTRVFHDAYNRDVRASIVGAGSMVAADRPSFSKSGVHLSATVASYIEFTNVAGAADGLNDIGIDGQEGAYGFCICVARSTGTSSSDFFVHLFCLLTRRMFRFCFFSDASTQC